RGRGVRRASAGLSRRRLPGGAAPLGGPAGKVTGRLTSAGYLGRARRSCGPRTRARGRREPRDKLPVLMIVGPGILFARGGRRWQPVGGNWAMNHDDKWDWSSDEIKRVGYRVVDLIADYLTTLPDRPLFQPCPAELIRGFADGALPQAGEGVDALLDEFASKVVAHPFGNGHPRFFGWVNSPPAIIGVFAEALAAAMNPSCAGGNHAAIYV